MFIIDRPYLSKILSIILCTVDVMYTTMIAPPTLYYDKPHLLVNTKHINNNKIVC